MASLVDAAPEVVRSAIRAQISELMLSCIEVKAEHCDEEEWRSGTTGAILEGRIGLLGEILDWI
jgi:hypothetical protein